MTGRVLRVIFGPKVMIMQTTNVRLGWRRAALFSSKAGLGPCRKRTWGDWLASGGYPNILDGGASPLPEHALNGSRASGKLRTTAPAGLRSRSGARCVSAKDHAAQLDKESRSYRTAKGNPLQSTAPPYPNYHEHDDLGAKYQPRGGGLVAFSATEVVAA